MSLRLSVACVLASSSLLASLLAACSEEAVAPSGPGVSIRVAPLDLAAIDFACYDIQVTNSPGGAGDVVWSAGTPGQKLTDGDGDTLCSDRYGNGGGGGLAYVGTCDADGGERVNSVTLWVDGLYTGQSDDESASPIESDGASGWRDPCPEGCRLEVPCRENADAPVDFDLTIMRNANQGFFDVAVSFEDIFCSAKVDCQPSLLADEVSGQRMPTIVMALVCSAGAGTTTLYMNDVVVTCRDKQYALSPVGRPGNRGGQAPGVGQTSVYYGPQAVGGVDACYLNSAFALDLASDDGDPAIGPDCVLTASATAASSGLFTSADGSFWTPPHAAYPQIIANVPITDEAGGLLCQRHPLGGPDGTLEATYTELTATGASYAYAMPCDGAPAAAPVSDPCAGGGCDLVDTTPAWDGSRTLGTMCDTGAYGETFTLTETTTIVGFSLFARTAQDMSPLEVVGQIVAFDTGSWRAVGPALWTSPDVRTTTPELSEMRFDVGALTLPAGTYMALLNSGGVGAADGNGGAEVGQVNGIAYEGGRAADTQCTDSADPQSYFWYNDGDNFAFILRGHH
ncbi:MAG: hypothetical protein U1F43_28645 [Myxococcota bacterium]